MTIVSDADLRVMRIRVETSDGVTTQTGSVDSQKSSDRAAEIVSTVTGVKRVKNLLVVKATD